MSQGDRGLGTLVNTQPHPVRKNVHTGYPHLIDSRSRRYADDIMRLHGSLRYGRLVEYAREAGSAYLVEDRHGLATVGLPNSAVPARYLKGLAGFRLAQYLALGWASPVVAARRALFGEPTYTGHPDDWHLVTLSADSGQILGYLTLAHSPDRNPVSVHHFAGRALFPVEEAHGVNLFAMADAPADLTTHEVFELKRFVHARTLHDAGRRLQVSMELILAVTKIVPTLSPRVRALIGDAEATFALRHLLLMGLSVTTVAGTTPLLREEHLLYPAYRARKVVKPFYAAVPDQNRQEELTRTLEDVLNSPQPGEAVRDLVRVTSSKVREVRYAG